MTAKGYRYEVSSDTAREMELVALRHLMNARLEYETMGNYDQSARITRVIMALSMTKPANV